MAEYQLQIRRDSAANWAAVNPVLQSGEPGYDVTNKIIKIGNGITAWNSLITAVDEPFVATEKTKLAGFLSVTEFGATGDGVTDDGPAFRAAIVAASSGAIILVPPPSTTYRIASSVVVDKTVHIMGGGRSNPSVTFAGGIVGFNISTGGVGSCISGLHMTGDRSSGQKAVYSIANHVSVYDCHLSLLDTAIHFNGGYGQRINGLTMRNIKDTLIYVQDGASVSISEVFYDTDGSWSGGSYTSPTYGIRLSADNAIVDQCTLIHAGTGLFVECPSARNLEFLSVSNSNFDSGLTVPSIIVRNSSASRTLRDVRFNNVVAGKSKQSVLIDGTSSLTYGVSFIGCTFHENTNEGVRIENGQDISLNGCRICGNSTAGSGQYPDVYSNTAGELSISHCKLGRMLGYTSSPNYGCIFDTLQGNVSLHRNKFSTGYTQRAMLDNGAGTTTFENNEGLVTDAAGVVTIGAAQTQATVTHGLYMAPTLQEINIHANSGWGSAAKSWVDTPTSTDFIIHVDQASGGAGVSFSWSVSIKGR